MENRQNLFIGFVVGVILVGVGGLRNVFDKASAESVLLFVLYFAVRIAATLCGGALRRA